MITDQNKSHYVYIKYFLCTIKQGVKMKNTFAGFVYNVLTVKEFW